MMFPLRNVNYCGIVLIGINRYCPQNPHLPPFCHFLHLKIRRIYRQATATPKYTNIKHQKRERDQYFIKKIQPKYEKEVNLLKSNKT